MHLGIQADQQTLYAISVQPAFHCQLHVQLALKAASCCASVTPVIGEMDGSGRHLLYGSPLSPYDPPAASTGELSSAQHVGFAACIYKTPVEPGRQHVSCLHCAWLAAHAWQWRQNRQTAYCMASASGRCRCSHRQRTVAAIHLIFLDHAAAAWLAACGAAVALATTPPIVLHALCRVHEFGLRMRTGVACGRM